MELFLSIASVLGAILIGAAIPGPSFLLVARISMALSRKDGFFAAIGMGLGASLFSVVVLLGLQFVFAAVPWLYFALKVAGGLYLMYMAVHIWRSASKPFVMSGKVEQVKVFAKRSFLLGLFTQLSNPKTAIVYGGIFAALLPQNIPVAISVALPLLVFLVEAGWYAVVAYALSTESSRAAYLRSKGHIDRMAGGLMGFLGIKLISAAQPDQ